MWSIDSMRRQGVVAGLGVLAFVLAGCTGGSGASTSSSSQKTVVGKPVSGGTVSFAQTPGAIPNWIWPFSSLAYFSVYNSSNLQQPMYRPLYWFGGHNEQPTIDYGLSVAKPPVYASDGRSVRVTLKPWKWSNGEPVNADDVLFWMHMVKAEKDNWAGTSPGGFPDNITNVTKTSEQDVKFTLDAKYSNNWFTYNELSQITPMPMAWDITHAGAAAGSGGCTKDQSQCPAVYKFLIGQAKDQQSYASSKIWGVVDGPWRLGSYSSSGNYTLVPNKAYSGSPKPQLDQVKFLPFTNDSAEFNVLKSGGTIDLGYIPPQDLPQKRAGAALPATNPVGDGYYLSPYYSWSFNYFVPNLNNPDLGPAFRQLYVRQALALTLNQPLGVEKAQRGYGYPNFGPVPVRPASRWLSPAAKQGTPYPFDPGRAKALLTGHGWTDQAGVMTCTRPGTAANQCGPEVQQGTRLSIKYVRTKMKTGSRAISAPQSGMTNCAVSSRMPFQISSSTGPSVVRGSGDEHVGHDGHRDAEQHEQGHPGVVDLPAGDRLDRPVDRPDDHEQQARRRWRCEDGAAGASDTVPCLAAGRAARTAGSRRRRRSASTATSPRPRRGGGPRTGRPCRGRGRPRASPRRRTRARRGSRSG